MANEPAGDPAVPQVREACASYRRDMTEVGMAWTYLVLAGLLEIGWPIGLKMGWTESGAKVLWLGFAILCMALSGAFLLLAQRVIPMGTAYAVWTGIGAVGTFVVGIIAFGDAVSSLRLVSAGLIIAGVVGLKFA